MTTRVIDWERIEAEYRAGVLSLREIAKLHAISEGAVRKRAKRDQWDRDLSARVQQKVRTALVRTALVRAPGTQRNRKTDQEVVDEHASVVINIVRGHRSQIGKSRELADTLLAQLKDAVQGRDRIQTAIEALFAGPDDTTRRTALLRVVSLPTHVCALKDLATATRTLVDLERQAFGLTDNEDVAPPAPITANEDKDEEERFRRLEERLAQVGREAADA